MQARCCFLLLFSVFFFFSQYCTLLLSVWERSPGLTLDHKRPVQDAVEHQRVVHRHPLPRHQLDHLLRSDPAQDGRHGVQLSRPEPHPVLHQRQRDPAPVGLRKAVRRQQPPQRRQEEVHVLLHRRGVAGARRAERARVPAVLLVEEPRGLAQQHPRHVRRLVRRPLLAPGERALRRLQHGDRALHSDGVDVARAVVVAAAAAGERPVFDDAQVGGVAAEARALVGGQQRRVAALACELLGGVREDDVAVFEGFAAVHAAQGGVALGGAGHVGDRAADREHAGVLIEATQTLQVNPEDVAATGWRVAIGVGEELLDLSRRPQHRHQVPVEVVCCFFEVRLLQGHVADVGDVSHKPHVRQDRLHTLLLLVRAQRLRHALVHPAVCRGLHTLLLLVHQRRLVQQHHPRHVRVLVRVGDRRQVEGVKVRLQRREGVRHAQVAASALREGLRHAVPAAHHGAVAAAVRRRGGRRAAAGGGLQLQQADEAVCLDDDEVHAVARA
eukprot:Rhum_TRINITY_DN13182_c3_g1::Rhum_TRINITY_DN13182_c3_g1_i1::g.57107::m.57107